MHYENCCRKYFHMFGSILKMLFFLQIFHIFSTIFLVSKQILLQKISKSQPNPNTTHHRNSNSTHGSKLRQSKATTTKTPLPHHHNNNKNQNHKERSVGQRSVGWRSMGRAARDRSSDWSMRSGLPLDRRIGACDRRTGACDLGFLSIIRLERVIVELELEVRRRRRRRDLGSLSLSLSLSLCASDSEMVWSENLSFKPFSWSKAHFLGQLQITSGKFIFHAQPNTRIYGKSFLEVVWSQNKHSLNWATRPENQKKALNTFECWIAYWMDTRRWLARGLIKIAVREHWLNPRILLQ